MIHSNSETSHENHKNSSMHKPAQQQERSLALQLAHISNMYMKLLEHAAHTKQPALSGQPSQASSPTRYSSAFQQQPAGSAAQVALHGPAQTSRPAQLAIEQQSQHRRVPCILAYQQELVDAICNGQNSILFLPTGTVAVPNGQAMLCQEHTMPTKHYAAVTVQSLMLRHS